MKAIALALAVALAAPTAALSAQASYTTYGWGCGQFAGNLQPAVLSCTDVPKVGTSIRVHFLGPHYIPGWNWSRIFPTLMTGLSRSQVGGVPLPFHVNWGPVGGPNCMLWCSAEFAVGIQSIPNWDRGSITIDIPDDLSLVGLTLYHQWYLTYLLGWAGGIEGFFILSNGGQMTIGA